MLAVAHRIAGIAFRTSSNVCLPRLQEEPFERFRVGDDVAPDVRQRIQKVDAGLYAPAVQDRLRAVQDWPAQVSIRMETDHAIVYDFACQELDFFYTEAYAGHSDGLEPEERLVIGDRAAAATLFRIHRVSPLSLTATPLKTEDRERLIHISEFSPQMIPRIPLLRAPAVQDLLRPGLDGLDEMKVFIYLDGLIVWNRIRDTIDYFYPEGGGKPRADPEARVAVNFRYLFAAFLPQFSALMVHCSGLIRHRRTALFLAPDAGGKTTVLEQAAGGRLLNDDQVIVRREGNELIAHATPFGRMTSGPCHAPLGGLFVLEKACRFELTPLQPVALVQSLWDEHRAYTSILHRSLKQRAFDLFYEMCHRVPVYRMRFPKDYVDWDAIDAATTAGDRPVPVPPAV